MTSAHQYARRLRKLRPEMEFTEREIELLVSDVWAAAVDHVRLFVLTADRGSVERFLEDDSPDVPLQWLEVGD